MLEEGIVRLYYRFKLDKFWFRKVMAQRMRSLMRWIMYVVLVWWQRRLCMARYRPFMVLRRLWLRRTVFTSFLPPKTTNRVSGTCHSSARSNSLNDTVARNFQ
ncbi:hypothetical protein E2C01_039223 [Portunus trituberculatus]|uniref:Uncharacterized protein n=1 Tax=Portunus trituberculatus TaxID=210409 RepID=A0A5B7FE76_PORTR|nr:hypothetical protein [Portunus trituberculatus]